MRTNRVQNGRAAEVVIIAILSLVACAAPAGELQASGQGNEPHAIPIALADVDDAVPPVVPGVGCALPVVLQSASDRARELASILPQFTATERVEHREADKVGKWRAPQIVTFKYLAELQEIRPGMLKMEETRDSATSPLVFRARWADFGLPAIALVFHPYFVDEYNMSCEGLGEWEGRPAWQVHFQQRPDRAARLRAYTVRNRSFPVRLKGRAWIAADSYQVLHIETDLLEPVPEIRLVKEHLVIDYDPVRFQEKDVELWLPNIADVYMNYQGRVFHRRHSFTDFLLFSVDVSQKISEPKLP